MNEFSSGKNIHTVEYIAAVEFNHLLVHPHPYTRNSYSSDTTEWPSYISKTIVDTSMIYGCGVEIIQYRPKMATPMKYVWKIV